MLIIGPTLIPLRIPTGWNVGYNHFTNVNPDNFRSDDFKHRWNFTEDLLQFSNESRGRILDLGWYPEMNPNGEYVLLLIDSLQADPDWSHPIYRFNSRNLEEITNKIEDVLIEIFKGNM